MKYISANIILSIHHIIERGIFEWLLSPYRKSWQTPRRQKTASIHLEWLFFFFNFLLFLIPEGT